MTETPNRPPNETEFQPRTEIISELVRLDRYVAGGQVTAGSLSRSMSSMPWVLA
jgi:hypothetical protein